VGAAVSQKEKPSSFIPFQFPTLLSKLSRSSAQRALQKSVALKIGKKIHSSAKGVIANDLPFFKSIFQHKEKAIELTAEFGFDEKEIAFLLNTKPSTKKVKDIYIKGEEKKASLVAERRKKFSPSHPFSAEKIHPEETGTQTSLK